MTAAVAPKRARTSEETRQLILDAAARLFADQGFLPTTVPDIVRAAGVGHGTFYVYFKNRRDILVALTEQAAQRDDRRPQLEGRSIRERVRLEITWYLMDYVEHLTLSKIWHEAATLDPDITAMVHEARLARTAEVQTWITDVAGPGIDPGAAATAITSMIEEFAYRWFVRNEGPGTTSADVLAAAETLSSLILAGLNLDTSEGS